MLTPELVEKYVRQTKNEVEKMLRTIFPIRGLRRTLRLISVEFKGTPDLFDFNRQKELKLKERSLTVPCRGTFELVDNDTGRVIDRDTVTLMQLPVMTPRMTFIINGNEYQATNQLRLRAGAYTRRQQNGIYETQINTGTGKNLLINLDPATGYFTLKAGSSNIPLYPFLKGIGLTDAYIGRYFGEELLDVNRRKFNGRSDRELRTFVKAFDLTRSENPEDIKEAVLNYFKLTPMDGEITKITLGKSFNTVTPEMILMSAQKLLKVMRGEAEEDDRDSLEFKKAYNFIDHITEKIYQYQPKLRQTVERNLNRDRDKVKDIVSAKELETPIREYFTRSTLSATTEQTNPLTVLGDFTKITITGEGGITNENAITRDMRDINPSTLGFLDPVHTPESSKIGVTLHLSQLTRIENKTLVTKMFDAKTGRIVDVTPVQASQSVVAFPEYYDPVAKKFKSNRVVAMDRKKIREVPASSVDYVIISPKAIFDTTTNMIPFLQNNQGNRAMTAGKMQEQAIPLKHREEPLVQTEIDNGITYEQQLGRVNAAVAPVSGVIVSLDPLKIKADDGKVVTVPLYKNFPLANGSFIHHELLDKIKVGVRVKKGEILADSNHTKNGVFAMGVNLNVAYMTYKGYTYEDGVVISERAAEKLTSVQLYTKEYEITSDHVLDKKMFAVQFPTDSMRLGNFGQLTEEGMVKKGAKVNPGDALVVGIKKREYSKEQILERSLRMLKRFKPDVLVWDGDFPGEVIDIVKTGTMIKFLIRTEEKAREGDKIVGRHGNKAIITKVLPVAEMPKTIDGEPIDVILNPATVPSRMNMGQVLETAAGEIAAKTNKPFVVNNFDGKNYLEEIRKLNRKLGIPEAKQIVDPQLGVIENPVFVGKQYMLRLQHTISHKFSARSIGTYDRYEQPGRGGDESAQALDPLTTYALLAHGAKENLREMAVIKGQQNDEFWRAFRVGAPLPKPKVPFVFDAFINNLQALGVKIDQTDQHFQMSVMTDKDVERMSNGKIENALVITARDLKEEKGGLFDPKATGGLAGDKWTHIDLAEPMPNPIFEQPIKVLLGLSTKDYNDILAGRKTLNGKTGGYAFREALSKINVQQELEKAKQQLQSTTSVTAKDNLYKKIRYLDALKRTGKKPEDYIMTKFPVLPPKFRPIYEGRDGSINSSDLNELYQHVVLMNQSLEYDRKSILLDQNEVGETRQEVYNAIKALQGLGQPITFRADRILKRMGIIKQIGGDNISGLQAKDAFFQRRVLRKRQDLSGRSVIAVGPELDIDEIGLPKEMAWKIFEMHTMREMVTKMGMRPETARQHLEQRSNVAEEALRRVAATTPVLLNRAPSLHQFSIMAFKPRIVEDKAIKLPSLVVTGFNADFDGDTMAVHVPVTESAKQEALEKMLPSKVLFKTGHGDFMIEPRHEQILGLYYLTKTPSPQMRIKGRFSTEQEALAAFNKAKAEARRKGIPPSWKTDEPIIVGNRKITIGKILVNQVLPPKYRNYDIEIDKKTLRDLFQRMNEDKLPSNVLVSVATKLKDLGNEYAYARGTTITLKDLDIDRSERDRAFREAQKKLGKNPPINKLIETYNQAEKRIEKSILEQGEGNTLVDMTRSGARGSMSNIRQVLGAPVLMMDNQNRIIPTPVTKSYSEGLNVAQYWTAMYGARKGMVDRQVSTELPGAFTKELINNVLDHLITERDCQTRRGKELSIDDKNVKHRLLAQNVTISGKIIAKRDDALTTQLIRELKKAGVTRVIVRTPLMCESKDGLCAKCFGLKPDGRLPVVGENIGIISAHAMTEPTTQMTMNTFHTGGVATGEAAKIKGFDRLQQILKMPENLPNKATLARIDGKVTKIVPGKAGGHEIYINDQMHFAGIGRKVTVKVGDIVKRGDKLTDGFIDPPELLRLTGDMNRVREYLTQELHEAYGGKIHHNVLETVVQKITNYTKVEDPGKSEAFLPGQIAPLNLVEHLNAKGAQIKHQPILKSIEVLPRIASDDWMAKMNFTHLKDAILTGAREAQKSTYKGSKNPIPPFAYGLEFGKSKLRY